MYHNRAVPEVRYGLESTGARFDRTRHTRAGRRTVEGAVLTTLATVMLVVAASYPTAVATLVAAAVGAVAATGYASEDTPPDDSTRRSGAEGG